MEWISVKERWPEEGVEVLLMGGGYDGKHPNMSVGHVELPSEGNHDGNYWVNCEYYELSQITHWMPLPEPPVQNQTQTETTKP